MLKFMRKEGVKDKTRWIKKDEEGWMKGKKGVEVR